MYAEADRLRRAGLYGEAHALFLQALELYKGYLPEFANLVATTLNALANVDIDRGKPRDAVGACVAALGIARMPDQPLPLVERTVVGTIFGTLAHALRMLGDLHGAEVMYTAAIRELREDPGEQLAVVLNNFGAFRSHIGANDTARLTYEQALRILDEHAPESAQRAAVLLNLGSVEADTGWPSKARDYLDQALELFRRAGNRRGEVQTLLALSNLDATLERWDEAATAAGQALTIAAADSPQSELHATTLGRVALLTRQQDRFEQALPLLEKAASMAEALSPHSRQSIELRSSVASLRAVLGDPNGAVEAARTSVAAAEALRGAVALGAARRSVAELTATTRDVLASVLISRDHPGDRAELVEVLEARRARELLDAIGSLGKDAARSDPDGDNTTAIRAERREAQRVLAYEHWARRQLESGTGGPLDLAELAAVAARAQSIVLSVDARLDDRRATGMVLGGDAIRSALSGEQAVLHCWTSPFGAAVVTITKAEITIRPIDDQGNRAADVESVAHAAAQNRTVDADALARLADTLLGDLPPAARQIIIIPDGVLHALPWALLPDPTDGQPFGVTRRLTHAASITTFIAVAAREHDRTPANEMLVLADPEYSAEQVSDSKARRLEGTRRELQLLESLFGTVTALTGKDATEGRVLDELPQHRYAHLACHGVPDKDNPLFAGLLLAVPREADRERHEGTDDVLQPWEVADLELSCDTVVLSACGSAQGRLLRGEGLVGMTHAFQIAGARQLLTSLWPVGDESTVTLMTSLYGHLLRGLGLAEALRLTREHHRRDMPPKEWAAWQVFGPDPT